MGDSLLAYLVFQSLDGTDGDLMGGWQSYSMR